MEVGVGYYIEKRVRRFRIGQDVFRETIFQMYFKGQVEFQRRCEGRVTVARVGNEMNKGRGWREANAQFLQETAVQCVQHTRWEEVSSEK